MTTLALTCTPGSILVTEPVAMMRLSKVSCRTSWESGSLTSIEVGPVSVPQPLTSVILFFFIRKWTPLTMPALTWRLRLWVGP